MTGRAPRCLRLVVGERGTNRCTNEQIPGAELCAHHLAEAYRDYLAILDAQWKAAAA